MRKDRYPHNAPHALARRNPGVNRFKRGSYVCNCGEKFTGINAWEKHKAAVRRAERESR